MQVSVEATGELGRRMKVQVPAERVEREIDARLKSMSRRAKIDGFRPGKVPLKVVKQRFGEQVRSEVVSEILQSTVNEAFAQQKLTPAGGPRIDLISAKPGQDLEYTASFEVYPEIELKGLEGIAVERPVAEVTEADIDAMVENLRRQRAVWQSVERGAQPGDRLQLDFDGRIEGQPFAGGKAEQALVVLGENRMLADFEAGLQGVRAGESREFDVRFPHDYHNAELAGKTARFQATVHRVEARKLPELDEAFCRSFGLAEGGMVKLRAEVAENMRREMADTVRRRMKDQVLAALLAANPLTLPQALVEEEIEHLREDALNRMGLRDSKKATELPRELFEEQAKRRVSLGLLIGAIINREQLQLDEQRVTQRLERMASDYSNPAEALRSLRASSAVMRQVESLVLEDQAVDWLLARAQIREQPTTFRELMHFEEQAAR